jgi:hypothetical protein
MLGIPTFRGLIFSEETLGMRSIHGRMVSFKMLNIPSFETKKVGRQILGAQILQKTGFRRGISLDTGVEFQENAAEIEKSKRFAPKVGNSLKLFPDQFAHFGNIIGR